MTRSLRFRLTFHVLVVLGMGLGAFCLIVFLLAGHALREGFDGRLHRESQALSHVIEEHSKSRFTFEYEIGPEGGPQGRRHGWRAPRELW